MAISVATLPTDFKSHAQALRDAPLIYLEEIAKQGDFLKLKLPLVPGGYFLNHPDLVQSVMVKNYRSFHKPFTLKYTANQLFGDNLFTSDGDLWRRLRSHLQPTFHIRQIQSHAKIMVRYTEDMLATWETGQTLDIPSAMMDLTLGTTTQAFFGKDLRVDGAGDALIRFIELFSKRISGFPLPAWIPTPTNLELKRLVKAITEIFDPLLADCKANLGKERTDVLSMLLRAQAQDDSGLLSDRQIKNEIINLFAAGYEVTAHSLAFALYHISQHPEVEAKIHTELDQVLGDQPITLDDLENLPYLEATLKESMRLLPVTALVLRQACEAVTIGDHTLPKNSLVVIAPWTLHRRSNIFPDPLEFKPERFLEGAEIPQFAYVPFSAGPRGCIGQAFAMMQMRINLAMILQRYRLTVAPDFQLEPFFQFNTRPKGGLPMTLQARQSQAILADV